MTCSFADINYFKPNESNLLHKQATGKNKVLNRLHSGYSYAKIPSISPIAPNPFMEIPISSSQQVIESIAFEMSKSYEVPKKKEGDDCMKKEIALEKIKNAINNNIDKKLLIEPLVLTSRSESYILQRKEEDFEKNLFHENTTTNTNYKCCNHITSNKKSCICTIA